MRSGSEEGSYLRLIDVLSLISRLESNQEEEGVLLFSSLELSDTQVYAPQIRARLGTASHFAK